MVWWKTVASVVAFLLGVGVSAPALAELNATWVDKAVAASQTSPTEDILDAEGAEEGSEYKSKVVEDAETSEAVMDNGATLGIQSETVKVVPAVETNPETKVTPVAEWPEGDFTGQSTVTYDANGKGTFDGGATTNVVTTKYGGYKEITKYAHSANVTDTGEQVGDFGSPYVNYTRSVTIPGAKKLTVEMKYQFWGWDDFLCAYAGKDVSSESCVGSLTGDLSGSEYSREKTFTVEGDSVSF